MKETLKICIILFVLIALYSTGCLIFTKGFLLKRFVVNENSSCNADFSVQSDDHGDDGCWQHSRFKRAIIIVIDALKYEFMKYDRNFKSEVHYLNKLPILNNLLSRKPQHARLYKFIADPPTTTLQRLKGLTTGSLPTFVDAGSNFASTEITEDNIIDQLIKQNKEIKFLGDDTWMGLFPSRFSKAFPYPSFNVKDLHTVDNGILKHLLPEIRKYDWDVLIAHFLGVDHCGHRFGPNHPAMAEKLTQMDNMLRNVTRVMKDDTILLVFGDHGMTRMGDHGGDSEDELEAGLFVYSPAQLTATASMQIEGSTVAQTDLVPTLALLLGVPIPFSNLGMVIKDLFTYCSWWKTGTSEIKQVYHAIKSLRLNAHQINSYIKAYSTLSSDFPKDKMRQLSDLLGHAENDLQALLTSMVKEGETPNILSRFKKLEEHYTQFITDVRQICQSIWAKFDVLSIFTGVLTMAVGLVLNVVILRIMCRPESVSWIPVYVGTAAASVYVAYAIIQTVYLSEYVSPLMLFVFGGTLFLLLCLLVKNSFGRNSEEKSENSVKSGQVTFDDLFATFICFLYMLVFFSNSFVVQEDSVTHFFLQTMIWIFGLKVIKLNLSRHQQKTHKEAAVSRQNKSKSNWNPLFLLVHPATITFLITITCSVLLRLSAPFRVCREEQWSCNDTVFMEPLSNLAVDAVGYRNTRYFFSIACLALFIISGRQWMKLYGNLNGFSPTIMVAKFAYPFAGICCGLHWAAQGLPQKVIDSLPWWQQILLAQLVYISILLSVTVLIYSPLCIYKLPSASDSGVSIPYKDLQGSQVIPHLYRQLQQHWNSEREEKAPVVYGLGSVYSAGVVQLVLAVGLILFLLLGDGLAPSLLFGMVAMFLFLEIYGAKRENRADMTDGLQPVSWSLVVTLGLFMSNFFYATGHQATVPAIRFEAAFTGFHGDFNYKVIPALLITLNTFSSHVFFIVISPLLIFWPHLEGALSQLMRFIQKSDRPWRGDFVAYDDREMFKKNIMRVICGLFFFSGIKVFGTMCAAGIHRRHLMVWKIFAPRFVYEGAAMFVTFAATMLVYLFVIRLDRAVHSFATLLNKQR